tara:strand:- start:3162 stop:5570 length:2409 start_codon:yes stop_codon:yes gene_type:complete
MITIFQDIKSTSTPFFKPIDVILNRVRDGKSKDLVLGIRKEKDKTQRNVLKQSLPAICFSGTFNKREDKALIDHSGFICLDFDGYATTKEMNEDKLRISIDEHTYSVFVSPSGNGLKVIVKIPQDPENHKNYFNSLERHFDSKYFDKTSKNISRVCYESYDKDIYINRDSKTWDTVAEHEYKEMDRVASKLTIPITNENKIVDILMRWWVKRYGLVEGERNNNVYILAAAFNDYGVNKSLAEYVMSQFESKDFPMTEIRTAINSAYNHSHKFGTKFYEDEEKISQVKQKIKRGVPRKEIKSDLLDQSISPDVIDNIITTIENDDVKFWTKSDKGAINIVHYLFRQFLEDNGFYKYLPDGGKSFIFVRVTNNLINHTSDEEIKDFVLSYLDGIEDMTIYNYFADKTRYFKDDFLSLLSSVDVYFMEDTKDSSYLYYTNCAVMVTKDAVEVIDYIDLGGYIWNDQVIKREFNICEILDCDYKTFISNISGDDSNRIMSMESTIGFLLHGYKNLSYCPAVILNDEVITDNPEGGTGKGLFVNGVSQMKKLCFIDGKVFNFDSSFPYQTLSVDTQILAFDDVKKNFNFERLFSVITEGITLERKNKDAIHIPFSKSPKIVITTNYAIKGKGNSFERRKWELEFKQFYTKEFTPQVEFGRLLFSEWDDDEWCRFDNYMIHNLQSYMNTGLIKSTFVNLGIRKLSAETCHEFIEWCGLVDNNTSEDKVKKDELLYKHLLYDDFVEDNPDFGPKAKMTISRTTFYKWLISYGIYMYNVQPIEGRDRLGRWIRFTDNKSEKPTTDVELLF